MNLPLFPPANLQDKTMMKPDTQSTFIEHSENGNVRARTTYRRFKFFYCLMDIAARDLMKRHGPHTS